MSTVLVVEDEQPILDSVCFSLRKEGHQVIGSGDGREALKLWRKHHPDLLILDLMLPGADGLDICREIRSQSPVPIIMLTAKADEIDRVLGLELGADDYLTKPFSMRELMARVKAVLRRGQPSPSLNGERLESGDLIIDATSHEATLHGELLKLAPREFELLRMLVRNRGRVLTRELILEQVWGEDVYCDPHTVDVHVRWLRQKIEADPGQPVRIVTVRGVGYKFTE